MNILVLNCGSATVKFKFFCFVNKKLEDIFSGTVDIEGEHARAIEKIIQSLPEKPHVIAHRVVHGGDFFHEPVIIDEKVLDGIRTMADWAPLHNPPAIQGIKAAQVAGVPQVAVFDTAFHQTMPKHAYTYALPLSVAEKYRIRRHGFHGTSFNYITKKYTEITGEKKPNIIALHLGNGASCAAIKEGRCIDTSMGPTPLEGLVMGTRCGDLDPAIVIRLQRAGMSLDQVEELLWRKSGLLGLAGENDLRKILLRKDEEAKLAIEIFCYRIKKYIGAYLAVLGETQAIVFTGGIGENSPVIRENVLAPLSNLGIILDQANNEKGKVRITADNSYPHAYIIPTNEELMIAKETLRIMKIVND